MELYWCEECGRIWTLDDMRYSAKCPFCGSFRVVFEPEDLRWPAG